MNLRGNNVAAFAGCVFATTMLAPTLPIETDRTRDGLVGAVRQVTTTSAGMTTMRTYDREGALIESTSRLASADDPNGQPQVRRFVYVYDEKKQRVREMSEDQGGPPYLSRRYAYDGEGHQRAEAAYHMCGTFSSLHVFSYDGDGRLKEQLTYQFRSLGKRVYDYDGAGRRKAVVLYKNAVPQSTIQYRYDDQGRMIEQLELTPQGAAGSTTTYQYDQDRLATEHFTNRMDPSLNAISTYEYDAQGNWTRKTTRRSRGLREPRTQQLEVTDRVFEYF